MHHRSMEERLRFNERTCLLSLTTVHVPFDSHEQP